MQAWASESIQLHRNLWFRLRCWVQDPTLWSTTPATVLARATPWTVISHLRGHLQNLVIPFEKQLSSKTRFHFCKFWRIFQIEEGTPTASRLGCRCKSLAQVLSSKNPSLYSMKRKLCKHKTKNNRCTAKIHIDKWDHHGFTMNHPVNNVSGAPLLTGCPGLACWTATSWRWPYHWKSWLWRISMSQSLRMKACLKIHYRMTLFFCSKFQHKTVVYCF